MKKTNARKRVVYNPFQNFREARKNGNGPAIINDVLITLLKRESLQQK